MGHRAIWAPRLHSHTNAESIANRPKKTKAYDLLEKRRRLLGDQHPDTLTSLSGIGALWEAQGKHAETVGLLAAFEPAARKSLTGGNRRRLAFFLMNLGLARTGLGEFAAAEANLLEAHPIFVQTAGPRHQHTHNCTQAAFDLYTAWHTAQPGKGYDAKAADWKKKLEQTKK